MSPTEEEDKHDAIEFLAQELAVQLEGSEQLETVTETAESEPGTQLHSCRPRLSPHDFFFFKALKSYTSYAKYRYELVCFCPHILIILGLWLFFARTRIFVMYLVYFSLGRYLR